MIKWEYCQVVVFNINNKDQCKISAHILKEDGKHQELFTQSKGPNNSGKLFAQLGGAGWELASSSVSLHTGNAMSHPGMNGEKMFEYIFKRPVG